MCPPGPVFLAFGTPNLKFFRKTIYSTQAKGEGLQNLVLNFRAKKNESVMYFQKKKDKNCFLDSFTLSNRNPKRKLCQSPSKIY